VIRDQIEAMDRPADDVEPPVDPGPRLRREDMLAETGMTEAALDALDDSGLLNRRRGGMYDAEDLAVAQLVCRLERFGLAPRHLRAFKSAADREVGLLAQTVRGRNPRREGTAAARVRAETDTLVELFCELHGALMRAGARREMAT
jgi:hypothetical protein